MSLCWHGSRAPILALLVASLLLAVTAGAQPPLPAGDNLLTNPGFESGLAGWTANGVAASSSHSQSGCCSASLTRTGTGWASIAQNVSVTPRATYSASGYFWLEPGGQNPQMQIEWRSAAGQVTHIDSLAACSSRTWCLCSVTSQAPDNATSAVVKAAVYIKGALAYVDDTSFVQTAPPPTETATSTVTATNTETPTPSATPTSTSTYTPSPTMSVPTATPIPSYTSTYTPSPTRPAAPPTSTASRTVTATRSPTASPTVSATATATSGTSSRVLINEVEYYSNHRDIEASYEWLELYNPSTMTATMTGWTISDNVASDVIPGLSIPPGGLVVVAARKANFLENYPWYSGPIVELGQPIGNGLANDGDRLILRDAGGQVVDSLSYGDDTSVFAPAIPTVTTRGYSLERRPLGRNTHNASDFQMQSHPSPGSGWDAAADTATPSPTASLAPTQTPLQTPTGTATETGTPTLTPTTAPTTTDTVMPSPSATVTATATETLLTTATPTETTEQTATATATDTATAQSTMTLSPWETPSSTTTPTASGTATPLPSPTPPATATQSPGSTATAQPTATVTATETATAPTIPSATATPPVYTLFLPVIGREPPPTPTPSATPDPHLVTINEILPKPEAIDWNGDGKIDSADEWVELYNGAPIPVDVSGWALDDELDAGSPLFFLPAGTVIPPHGYLLLFGKETGINFANTKDIVRLLYRTGELLEDFRYYATWYDRSFSKTVDGGHEWTYWYPPSPGQPNRP